MKQFILNKISFIGDAYYIASGWLDIFEEYNDLIIFLQEEKESDQWSYESHRLDEISKSIEFKK